ncbi:hypothetical protein BLNAU_13642 [Blattamonas nauphoetae]|nr:hypothetical protein BLNAU_13642 [Blattamonas nauphoetae]
MTTVKRRVIELILHIIISQVILLDELIFNDEITYVLQVLVSAADLGVDSQGGITQTTSISQVPEKVNIVELLVQPSNQKHFS